MQLSGFFIFWTEGPILYSRAPVQNSKSSMIPTSLRCGDTWSIEIPADENYPNSEYTPHLRFIGIHHGDGTSRRAGCRLEPRESFVIGEAEIDKGGEPATD